MVGDKKRREYIVTIINNSMLACKTFDIMYNSIKNNSPDLFDEEWFVLFPNNMALDEYLDERIYKRVRFLGYQAYKSSDIYTLKFMLINFIEELVSYNGNLTYIDADHVFLKPLKLQRIKNNEMIFSSEDSIIRSDNYGIIKNYNASFIRASLETWSKVMYAWKEKYEELENDILSRFREEIAFSLSVKENNIDVTQLSSYTQSNFQKFNKNCICFHYGGEYAQAKLIKTYIKDLNYQSINWEILSDNDLWILEKVYKIINGI